MAEPVQDMLSKFGIDTRSQQEILQERANQNMRDAMSAERVERYPGDAGLQQAGAAFGTLLGNKFNNKLTAQQQREQETAKEARAIVAQQTADGLYRDSAGKVDPVARARALEKEMAKALVRRQDQRGIAMLIEIDEKERALAKDDRERRKDNLDIERTEQQINAEEYNVSRRVTNEMSEVWPMDSVDPNDSVQLYIDAQGNARNPSTMDVVYPAGEWSKRPPITPNLVRKAVAGDLTEEEKALLPSDKERSAMMRRERDVMTSMRLGIGITNAMKDAVNPDGTLNILSTGGKFTAGAVSLFDNLMSAGRGLADALIIEKGDGTTAKFGSSKAYADKYVAQNPEVFAGIDYSEYGIDRTDVRAQQRINAMFTQYAYAKARLNEENGRISDVDFEHAITQIAAAATDPEALRQVLSGDVENSVAEYEHWVEQMHPSILPLVRTPRAAQRFDDLKTEWGSAFEQDFGSAAEVGPGMKTETRDMTPPLSTPIKNKGVEMSTTEFLNGGYSDEGQFLDSFITEEEDE